MKLIKDKCSIIYKDFFTLRGTPLEVFEYRLGNGSAFDWIIEPPHFHQAASFTIDQPFPGQFQYAR